MPSFDSIVVGEDWISEHFFTTDSIKESFQAEVIKLRKSWDEQVKEGHASTLSRFSEVRGRLQILLAELAEDSAGASEAYALLRSALGFKGTTAAVAFERSGTETLVPGVWTSDNGDVLFLEAGAADAAEDVLSSVRPLGRVLADGKETPSLTVAKVVSETFLAERSPKYVVIMAGRWLVLTEQERWAEGRYLAVDVLLVADRNDNKKNGETDRFLAIFGRDSLMPSPDGSIWWDGVLEASVKHTVGVSQDLREGIRRSIEIIANDVLTRRASQGLLVEDADGQVLARQSLRFLYRILFLLYAEASPEMGVLPIGAGEYNEGYGLDRLRELTLVNIQSQESQRGTHIYESLERLFRLVDGGHKPTRGSSAPDDPSGDNEGLVFQPLKADLFQSSATSLINDAKLSNSELQRVLQHLLLSKESRGKDRGFISYAELGINQLGAVYEGLMSYTGFIAAEPLYEVAKDGNPEKGSWVVPVDRSESIDAKHFVKYEDERTGEKKLVLHETGSFVFRLAGRERQQSASYYTPEVLTKFVVSQALEELLDQNNQKTAADDILNLTVCEPALGSGAFALEAVRQLADEYLKRKQDELDVRIPADEYPQELQKVKAQIALHQVHGVDLNSTAVELAEVSLWLDTMAKDLQAPWFGLRLRRGNSLIGARRATYSRQSLNDKSWLKSAPQDAPLTGLVEAMNNETDDPNVVGRVHHFLLPAEGWGAAADAKEVKDLAREAQQELKVWRNKIRSKPGKSQVERMVNLGRRIESLWKLTLRRLQVAESEARRDVDYFGKRPLDVEPYTGIQSQLNVVSREEIEASLNDPNGAYQRLRRVMDAWNALWFWPLTERATGGATPPTWDEWLAALEAILGLQGKESKMTGQQTFGAASTWEELNDAEKADLEFALVVDIEIAKKQNPWLQVCENIAADQGFFHWELDFAPVFGRGGFNLQVGNPPWVRPRADESALLAEGDPWWQLTDKPTQAVVVTRRQETLAMPGMTDFFVAASIPISITAGYLGDGTNFPALAGLQPDLYRAFMTMTWRLMRGSGVVSLVHPETHLHEAEARTLRQDAYRRLRRRWHFVNSLKLFEIGDTKKYGVHVYGSPARNVDFIMSAFLNHPDTATKSLVHNGSGELPGIKYQDYWDLRPHAGRITRVNEKTLADWSTFTENSLVPLDQVRAMAPVNSAGAKILAKLSKAARINQYKMSYTRGFDESIDRKKGLFEVGSNAAGRVDDVILQGPHFAVGNPLAKSPKEIVRSTNDWVENDLESLSQYRPRTNYIPGANGTAFREAASRWGNDRLLATEFYRVAWRRMIATNSARSLHVALLPPGPSHVNTVYTGASTSDAEFQQLLAAVGTLMSLPLDFLVRNLGLADLRPDDIDRLPTVGPAHPLFFELAVRVARMNCLTEEYSELWKSAFKENWKNAGWGTSGIRVKRSLGDVEPLWTTSTPLRRGAERTKASTELDVLVAIMLEISIDDLISIYRTQFPVFSRYESEKVFDLSGRDVPNEIRKSFEKRGNELSLAERTWTHPQSGVEYVFELPFQSYDREEDMRKAYAHFSSMLGKTS